MIFLFILFGIAVYHGAVLWLALRFRQQPWFRYWFSGIVLFGLLMAWKDEVYKRWMLEEGACARRKATLGFHILAPVRTPARAVTWIERPASLPPDFGEHETVDNDRSFDGRTSVKSTNLLFCTNADYSKRWACIVPGVRDVVTQTERWPLFSRWGIEHRRELVDQGVAVRRAEHIEWSGSAFIRAFTGLNIPFFTNTLSCGGEWHGAGGLNDWPKWAVQVDGVNDGGSTASNDRPGSARVR